MEGNSIDSPIPARMVATQSRKPALKIVFGVPWFLPDSIGGTEVYVAGLAEELQTLGIECVVAVPGKNDKFTTSSYRNIRTVQYPTPQGQEEPQDILASKPVNAFNDWLSSERPDIYHQHDWSLNCGLPHLTAAKEMGIPAFMTVHLAKLICISATMICEGVSQCDGQIIEQRCARCFMKSRGVPSGLAAPLAGISAPVSATLRNLPGVGRLVSSRMRARRVLEGVKRVSETVDCIITVSQWLRSALLINGVPEERTAFVRSGVHPEVAALANPRARESNKLLRIGFLGRLIEPKGLHVLIAALQRLSKMGTPFHLKVLGLTDNGRPSVAYRERLEKMAAGEPQIHFLYNQPRAAINDFYENIDVLAVPSQLLENAPLVVLEANAWKIPVIGSDLGGIREMVRDQVDGVLVPHSDVDAWTNALDRLAREPAILQRLRSNISSVRTMRETALEMADLYRNVIETGRSAALPERSH